MIFIELDNEIYGIMTAELLKVHGQNPKFNLKVTYILPDDDYRKVKTIFDSAFHGIKKSNVKKAIAHNLIMYSRTGSKSHLAVCKLLIHRFGIVQFSPIGIIFLN